MNKALIVTLGLVLASCGKGTESPAAPSGGPCGNLTINGANINVACGGNATQTTQTPSPTPVPANSDCRVDWIRKSGPDYIPVSGEATYSITPMQTFKDATGATQEVPVSDPCNNARPVPKWLSSDTRVLVVTPVNTGFEAKVKRLGTGRATVSVTFEDRTVAWEIQGSDETPTPSPTPEPTAFPTPVPVPTLQPPCPSLVGCVPPPPMCRPSSPCPSPTPRRGSNG